MKFVIGWVLVFFIIGSLNLDAQWVTAYKRGIIELKPDAAFAKKTQWDDILYNSVEDITIAQDGTIFMTQGHENRLHIVSSAGDLSKTFSRFGEGPGDVYSPASLSILDGKYLVVGEYAERHRISIFDLSGKFVKIVKTKHAPFQPIALKNNKIAYLTHQFLNPKTIEKVKKVKVLIYIKDIMTGSENLVESIDLIQRRASSGENGLVLTSGSDLAHITRTINNNLLVGATNRNFLNIFDETGKRLKTFSLNLKPIPVTGDYIAKYKKQILDSVDKNVPRSNREFFRSILKNASFSDCFGSTLPLFSSILVDSDGNILVFKQKVDPDSNNDFFQVYSFDGVFTCETQLKWGEFKPVNLSRGNGIQFTKTGIVGIFEIDLKDDTIYKLMKFNPR